MYIDSQIFYKLSYYNKYSSNRVNSFSKHFLHLYVNVIVSYGIYLISYFQLYKSGV